jgi:DNA repair exonuclease SbcCD ATPase subunit
VKCTVSSFQGDTGKEAVTKAIQVQTSEDDLEPSRNICNGLQKEVEGLHTTGKEVEELQMEHVGFMQKVDQLGDPQNVMERLQAKENELEKLQKERVELVTKADQLSDLQKEVERLQTKEKEVEELQKERFELVTKVNKIRNIQKEVERLNVKLLEIYDNEMEDWDLKNCNEIKVKLCRLIGLAEDYLSLSERSQATEATLEQRDVYNPNYNENPGLILELQALRAFVFRLKEAQISNGMLRRLVNEFQQVVTEHEDKIKQLLIQAEPILSGSKRQVSHSLL